MSQFRPPQPEPAQSYEQWLQPSMYQPPQQPPAKQPILPTKARTSPSGSRAIWLAFTIGIFIGVSIGYPVWHGIPNNLIANTTQQQPTNSQQTFYQVGQTLSNSTWNVTLNSVNTSTGNGSSQPTAGNIFLVVDVTAQNLSSSPQIVSSVATFTLKDDTGQVYQETITGIGEPPDTTALQPNDTLRGQISYDVPKSLNHFTFQFQDTNGSTGTWEFSV